MNTAVKMPFVHVSLRSFKIQNQNWKILNMSCLYIYAYRWIAQEYNYTMIIEIKACLDIISVNFLCSACLHNKQWEEGNF